jgi:hypothetical protein
MSNFKRNEIHLLSFQRCIGDQKKNKISRGMLECSFYRTLYLFALASSSEANKEIKIAHFKDVSEEIKVPFSVSLEDFSVEIEMTCYVVFSLFLFALASSS